MGTRPEARDRPGATAEAQSLKALFVHAAGLSSAESMRLADHWRAAAAPRASPTTRGIAAGAATQAWRDAAEVVGERRIRELRQAAHGALWAGDPGSRRLAGWPALQRLAERARRASDQAFRFAAILLVAAIGAFVLGAAIELLGGRDVRTEINRAIEGTGSFVWRIILAGLFGGLGLYGVGLEIRAWLPRTPSDATDGLTAAAIAIAIEHRTPPAAEGVPVALAKPWQSAIHGRPLPPISGLGRPAAGAVAWLLIIMGAFGVGAALLGEEAAERVAPELLGAIGTVVLVVGVVRVVAVGRLLLRPGQGRPAIPWLLVELGVGVGVAALGAWLLLAGWSLSAGVIPASG